MKDKIQKLINLYEMRSSQNLGMIMDIQLKGFNVLKEEIELRHILEFQNNCYLEIIQNLKEILE